MAEWFKSNALLLLLLAGTVFTFCWLMRQRRALNLKWYTALLAALAHTAWGVFCVKAFAFAEAGFDSDALGNMSLFGAVFFMPVFYFALAKILHVKAKTVFDLCTICMLFTLMCARINCLIAGCCQGLHIPGSELRWPTRELEILFYIAAMLVIAKKLRRGNTGGTIYPAYMMAYGIFRFIIEWFRVHSGSSALHPAHIFAILSFLIGFSIYSELKKKLLGGKHQ